MPIVPFRALDVYAGDDAGSAPTKADLAPQLVPLRIVRTAGGASLDHAVFAIDLVAAGFRVIDVQTPVGWSKQIDVRHQPDDGPERAVFWGELTVQEIVLDQSEQVIVTARVEPYHFGDSLAGYYVRDARSGDSTLIHRDPAFNPLVDGVIEKNRNGWNTFDDEEDGWHLWVDPEAVRTNRARLYQVLSLDLITHWTLEQATDTLVRMLNADETFISNPEAISAPDWTQAPRPDNIVLPRGKFLPAYLDALLHPHGYDWYLRPELIDGPLFANKPRIVIFRRGVGPEKELRLQRPFEALDVDLTNAEESRIETNVGDLANVVVGYGSEIEREVTIELYRGWPEEQDEKTPDDLDRSVEDSDHAENPNAWRRWVANEAGDYSNLRKNTGKGKIPEAPLDLSAVFVVAVPKRRKLGRCLTKDGSGRRRPPLVEWWNPEGGEDLDGAWEEVPSGWGAQVLADQIGIHFDGDRPPEPLVDCGDDARIRITGTLTGDRRLSRNIDRRASSPNLRDVVLTLDLSDRFHDRQLKSGAWEGHDSNGVHGGFGSVLADDPNGADTRNDESALEDYLEKIQDAAESAQMRGRFVVFGITYEYEIGDLITKIAGREISLNRNSPDAATPRYLQVTGIVLDYQRQRTELIVEAAEANR